MGCGGQHLASNYHMLVRPDWGPYYVTESRVEKKGRCEQCLESIVDISESLEPGNKEVMEGSGISHLLGWTMG